MNEVQAAIYAYFHNGEMPPDDKKEWQPDPPKQWWAKAGDREVRRPIGDDAKQALDPWSK